MIGMIASIAVEAAAIAMDNRNSEAGMIPSRTPEQRQAIIELGRQLEAFGFMSREINADREST